MRILLDHCVHAKLAVMLEGHEVRHTEAMGWQQLSNGNLLAAAVEHGFEVFITTDKGVRHQQNLKKFPLSIISVELRRVTLPPLVEAVPAILAILESLEASGQQHKCVVVDPTGHRTIS